MVFFDLLPRNQTVNSDACCRQLKKLNAAVKEKRPELVKKLNFVLCIKKNVFNLYKKNRQLLLGQPNIYFIDYYDYVEFRCYNMNKCDKSSAFLILKQYYTKFS